MPKTSCKDCGEEIIFIKMVTGGTMPVNSPSSVGLRSNLEGDRKVVVVVRGSDLGHLLQVGDADIARVYTPHWATCTDPDHFRKA